MAPISQLSAILAPLILLFSRATAITLTGRRDLTSMDMSSANPAAVMAAGTNGVKGATVPQIQWGSNATHIEVQLTYPTTGWLALGLSPTGGMDQSDVLFGYVDDRTGEVVIQDRFLSADMTKGVNLSLDGQQDWVKVSGSQNASHTTLRAARKLRTCDAADRPFTSASMKVIFSYNARDPQSKTGPLQKHTQRGSAEINFLASSTARLPTEPIVQQLNFTMDNLQVPGGESTAYFCRLIKVPKLARKLHAVSELPIIDPRNSKIIHHILIFRCNSLPPSANVNEAFSCDPKSDTGAMSLCQTMIGGWAVGGEGSYYPSEAGLPFSADMEAIYVLLQMHYNNPSLQSFVDSSGISFSLTDKLRKYDIGSLTTGVVNFDSIFTIPPGLDEFKMTAQCSDQCTSMIPKEGITIFSAAVHMHTRGRVGVARHFRGNQELAPLVNDQHYDFNYQTGVEVSPPRKFLPGDRIVIECTFSTAEEEDFIFGGEGTGNEMCMGFFDYYPKNDLVVCAAFYQTGGYINAIGLPASQLFSAGITNSPKQTLADALKTPKLSPADSKKTTQNLETFVKQKNWTTADVRKLEEFYRSKQYVGVCNMGATNFTLVSNDNPPFIEALDIHDMSSYDC